MASMPLTIATAELLRARTTAFSMPFRPTRAVGVGAKLQAPHRPAVPPNQVFPFGPMSGESRSGALGAAWATEGP